MPRRNRAERHEPRPLGGAWGSRRVESGSGGDWIVQAVMGDQARKVYRCPGCDHEIRPRVAHVVVWPAAESGTADERRHWHQGCWQARDRRGPAARRGTRAG